MSVKLVPLNEIFRIHHGNKFDLNKMSQCTSSPEAVAFIGRSGERNGFDCFVEKLGTIEPYAAGMITVALGGSALASFVQPRPFYTAQNIDVLHPLEAMSLDEKLYYCLCIQANRFRYSTFGREANRTLKHVPVPSRDCIPAWVSGATEVAVETFCDRMLNAVGKPPAIVRESSI